MAEQTLSEELARHHVALRLSQIPEAVIEAAKLHLLDSLGCLLAGSRLEPGRLAYDLAIAVSGCGFHSESTLFGTASRVPFLEAIQAMSVAAHGGEMDDIHTGAGTCIGGIIIPALIAMAGRQGGSGRRFLEATIIGYETTARVGLAINAPDLFSRGWWPSTICGAFGVAAAGAKFLGWPVEKTVNALGIASLHAGGMITGGNEGVTARHLVFGRAAQNGALSLIAVEQGFTGPRRAFEDPRGFCLTLSSEPRWEFLQPGNKYFLPEVAFKPYPCARQLHAGVEALLTLVQEHSMTPGTIAEIVLSVPTHNASMVNRPSVPMNRAATLGSGQYVMAVTAIRREMTLASFEDRFLKSDEVLGLMGRVKVIGETELNRYFPQYWPARVAVRLSDGRSYAHEIIVPKGESPNPMPAIEIKEKFLGLAGPVIGTERANSVIREVGSLEESDSLEPMIGSLMLPG
jgi:2-methylcitrate dehydratase PrpD